MSCRYSDLERNDYVDGLLDPQERQAFESHLGSCDRCSVAIGELSDIVRQAKELAPIAPEQDLRAAIRAQLEAGATGVVTQSSTTDEMASDDLDQPIDELAQRRSMSASATNGDVASPTGGSGRTPLFKHWWIGVAAAFCVVLLVGAWSAGRWSGSGASGEAVSSSETELEGNWSQVRADYDAMSAELEREFSQSRGELPDDVLAEVDRTLRLLNDAIADLQISTEQEDGDQESMKQLTALYRKKMELLWKTSVLASAGQRT